jgi:hypothetical protein
VGVLVRVFIAGGSTVGVLVAACSSVCWSSEAGVRRVLVGVLVAVFVGCWLG